MITYEKHQRYDEMKQSTKRTLGSANGDPMESFRTKDICT